MHGSRFSLEPDLLVAVPGFFLAPDLLFAVPGFSLASDFLVAVFACFLAAWMLCLEALSAPSRFCPEKPAINITNVAGQSVSIIHAGMLTKNDIYER